jgi:RNA polymerase sigma factor (sigma-70 family)
MGDRKEWMPGETNWKESTWRDAIGYAPKLEAYLRGKMRTREDTEDAMQNAYLRALESDGRKGREPEHVPAFLQTLGLREYLTQLRKEKIRFAGARNQVPFKDDNDREFFFNSIADASLNPEEQARAQEMAQVVERTVKQMSDKRQRIFDLRLMQNLPIDEVAQAMGIPKGTVKCETSRIRDTVQQALVSNGFMPGQRETDGLVHNKRKLTEQERTIYRFFDEAYREGKTLPTLSEIRQLLNGDGHRLKPASLKSYYSTAKGYWAAQNRGSQQKNGDAAADGQSFAERAAAKEPSSTEQGRW